MRRMMAIGLGLAVLASCKSIEKPDRNIEWAPDVRLAAVPAPPAAGRKSVVVAQDGARRAYLRETPDAADREPQHVYLEAGGQTYVILGVPYERKPITNLYWQDSLTLVFDRYYDEHNGIRFFIDCRKGILGRASAIRR